MKKRSNVQVNNFSAGTAVMFFGSLAASFDCCCMCCFGTGGLIRRFI